MNRVKKFRAWDRDLKVMYYRNPHKSIFLNKNLELLDEELVYMEFIGLKDKFGVDVYEEDILKQINYHGVKQIREVKFEMSCGSCCSQVYGFSASGKRHLDFIRLDEEFEVIGNIYENPELIK